MLQGLKERLEDLIPKKQAQIKEFRKLAGNKVVGEVTVDMMYGGMRGIKGMLGEMKGIKCSSFCRVCLLE